ncbi:transposase [Streptomyces sp. NPDC003328]
MTSDTGPHACSICTPASGKAGRSAPTSTSSARTRRPPSRPAAAATPPSPPDRPGRCGSTTYGRGGALAYLAAYDVHHARVFGRTEPRTGIDPFMNLAAQVMTREPYASAKRVFWVVDNGSSHRGQKAACRLAAAFPNTIMVHTPVHASWLNQVEIYFSVVQRKVVSPNGFTDLAQVGDRLRAFEDRYNSTAQPFQWKFTTSDLDDLLARLDRHAPADRQEESSAALAARSTPEGL